MLDLRRFLFITSLLGSGCAHQGVTPPPTWQFKQIFCDLFEKDNKRFFKVVSFRQHHTIGCFNTPAVSYECPPGMRLLLELGPDKTLQPTWLINSDIETGILRGVVYITDGRMKSAPLTLGCYANK